jgi:hypothetical protein
MEVPFSWLHHLAKIPCPNISTLRVIISTYEVKRGTQTCNLKQTALSLTFGVRIITKLETSSRNIQRSQS